MLLSKRRIIVTGGPTREWIDPVRYISNASSGKMGIALADAALKRSGDVVFIHGPMDKKILHDKNFRLLEIETTNELLNAVISELVPGCVVIMAAAPADFTPREKYSTKIKKEEGSDEFILKLKKNPDILKNVTKRKADDSALKNIFVVGFAAETDDTENNALKKLKNKNLDMICLNDITQKDAGIASDNNRVIIFTRVNGDRDEINKTELPLLSKAETAERILDQIEMSLKNNTI